MHEISDEKPSSPVTSAKMHLFILNPKSFRQEWKMEQVLSVINSIFDSTENNNFKIHISRFPRDATGFIPAFACKLPEGTMLRVYAVGGDGILFDCLNGIIGLKNAELAAVPYGRTNNFIRGFGRNEINNFKNISRQINAPVIPIDVMRCANNYALEYCAIGIEAEAVRYAEKFRQRMDKGNPIKRWISRHMYTWHYFAGGLAAAFDKRLLHQEYDVQIDDEKFKGLFWGLSIFNGPYYGGNLHPSNISMPNDGILDMLVIRGKRFLLTYCLLPLYVTGRYKSSQRNISLKQGRNIKICSKDILVVSIDDNTFYENELNIELLPGAVNFADASKSGYRGVSND